MRLLISLGILSASVLAYRWGMGVSSPRYDSRYAVQAVEWIQGIVARVDTWLVRLKVGIIDRLELDRLAWLRLRAQYTPEMS